MLFPSPLVGEGGACGAIAKHEPGEGSESNAGADPSPASLMLTHSLGTLSHKGRRKEGHRVRAIFPLVSP